MQTIFSCFERKKSFTKITISHNEYEKKKEKAIPFFLYAKKIFTLPSLLLT